MEKRTGLRAYGTYGPMPVSARAELHIQASDQKPTFSHYTLVPCFLSNGPMCHSLGKPAKPEVWALTGGREGWLTGSWCRSRWRARYHVPLAPIVQPDALWFCFCWTSATGIHMSHMYWGTVSQTGFFRGRYQNLSPAEWPWVAIYLMLSFLLWKMLMVPSSPRDLERLNEISGT